MHDDDGATAQLAVRTLETDDCSWAAGLIDDRRRQYAEYSPRFWNPTDGADEIHAAFLMWLVLQESTISLRTDHGFAIGMVQGSRLMVDDFTVDDDERWLTDGRALLTVIADQARELHGIDHIRVVTATLDEPKRSMLQTIGLEVGARWWVNEIEPTAGPGLLGTQRIAEHDAILMDAPPVYSTGGPIVLVEEPNDAALADLATGAAQRGAVLLIAAKEPGTADEPALVAAGFTNPSEFYDGPPNVGGAK